MVFLLIDCRDQRVPLVLPSRKPTAPPLHENPVSSASRGGHFRHFPLVRDVLRIRTAEAIGEASVFLAQGAQFGTAHLLHCPSQFGWGTVRRSAVAKSDRGFDVVDQGMDDFDVNFLHAIGPFGEGSPYFCVG